MNNPDYDYLWKDVVTSLFEEFLLFFSPDLYERVDFSVQPEFLEQELLTILPESSSNKRTSDKLVKLRLKNGNEQWVYVHIEVQGDYKKEFPKRMFQSFYRVMDFYEKPVYAMALFTDERASYNKDQYSYEFLETKVTYSYKTYRIASQTETTLLQSHNPFALVVLAGLYAIKSKKEKNLTYYFKRYLMTILFQDKMKEESMTRENIRKLLLFIDKILTMPFEEEAALIQEMKPVIEREGSVVGLSIEDIVLGQYLLNEAREKAKKEGRELGIQEGREVGRAEGRREQKIEIAVKLLQLNVGLEAIIEATGLTKDEIDKLRN
ncbi:putative transposase/invertase (TIGR01784 family) [Bacillus mesophilus]|uniref:Rpn family recombination-promoting nuclease/putative transposase n=1 Tax=Bacillus mesophilus TaxID=1808955 RepID=A0A6M0QAU3_9BACI|nr:hypothetical protein [Bacillus mesophilus]MBM7662823.1 putative transposase/invertase (TIGR01784 family) [Bacillus mesophilus]NEY73413.1 hypothetical protein [Bacillus mesophilus]